ncbi:hypothetical protein INT48_001562 [Thamnidium elegans]|uniref:Uncharacterized protein n=1 Tax=Thamnidium elegans TaxID=101142 RepID=A0A8H7SN76_9FUNG|nr:hypothetical protein INT48_001562 [Thamnidium elegans]
MKKKLFAPPFRITSNEIVYKNVYYNGFHSLQQFKIENLTIETIVVKLDSTLKDQIGFQLENENIKDLDLSTENLATNTAAWTTFTAPQDLSQFNQLFNYVNHTDHLKLQPNQKLIFIIAFLPIILDLSTAANLIHIDGSVFFTCNDYTLDLDFHATVCQSILASDELDTGLMFEDSLIEYTRFNFVDASTFMILNHNQPEPIAPFSHYTFRVIFTPKEVGKFNYDLQIENKNDVQNIIQTKIHATMRAFMHWDTLVVTSGNSLDFGDCISGAWNNQQIVLNNISESPIDIEFIADGAELGFDIMPWSNSSKSSITATGHLSSSSDTSPLSPTASHETLGSIEEYSSTKSIADVDNIDMLTAFNTVYINDVSSVTSSIKQVEFTTEHCNTKIEDMVLKPGVERVIQVSYRPPLEAPSSICAGQFIRRHFNIMLQYRPNKSAKPKELKLIQCKAQTCTSFVKVTPQVIDFGDTNVGTQKSFPIQIINQSDICAHVELVFESKVLNCTQGELLMQPKSTIEINLDIYPRKVNMVYRRQIKLKNYLNPDNDQIIEVSSTNIDKYRVTFHSLFYRILTPTGANFLDFGPIALNSPAIRTCTLVNIRDTSLLLGITTSSQQEIVIYTKKKNKSSATSSTETELKKHRITPSVTDALLSKKCRTRLTNAQYNSTAYLDLATVPHERFSSFKHKRNMVRHMTFESNALNKNQSETCKLKKNKVNNSLKVVADGSIVIPTSNHKSLTFIAQHKRYKKKKQQSCVGITGTTTHLKKTREKTVDWPDIAGKSRVPLDDLVSILEHGSLSRTPLFARQSLEEQFVRYQLAWRTELARLIETGELVSTSLLQLNPKEEEEIVIVYTPTITNHSLTSKNAASISFRLIDFDQTAISTSSSDDDEESTANLDYQQRSRYYKNFIPVLRKVIVRAQVCKSCMELGQRNINFGIVDRGDRHHKTIVLHNKSETPLLYTIKKSGSIASGDIHIGAGRYGVIRSFGKKEIEFTFVPTLPGSFMEQLEVINIRDKQDTNIISLKAMIRRPESFTMKLSTPELIFNACVNNLSKETIILTNTNKKSRMFEIGVEFDHVQPQQPYKVEFFIDHGYQQNEKMFLTTEEEEEIENLEQKLKIAERKNQPEKIKRYLKRLSKLKKQQDLSQLSSEEATEDEIVKQKVIIDEDNTLFHLGSNASKSISVCFRAIVQKTNNEGQILRQTNSFGRILIHEHKNMDTRKIISFSVNPCKDHETCLT